MALAFLNPVSAGPVADSTITVAHDCGSGDDRWLFVAVPLFSAGETPTVSGVSYDGAALSPVVQGEHLYAGNTNVVRAEWWALDVAAAGKTGSNNVVVTLSGAADRLAVIAFTATGCGGPGLDTNTAGGNLSVVSAAIDTAADTGRVVGLWTGTAARGVTPGTGNTVVVARDDGTAPPNNIVAWAGWEPGTGGSVAWDITLSSAVRSAAAVIELLEAEEGGGDEIIEEVALVAETDAALALAAAKSLVLAQATESDLAQGVVRVKRVTLAQALERDAALAIAIGGLAVVIDGPTLAALATTGRTFVELAGSGRTLTVLAGTGKTTVDVD